KVRLLAAELGIPLNKVPVDPRIGETRTSEFLAKNPNGRVPTLEEDGFVLWESPAILKYLSAKHPSATSAAPTPRLRLRSISGSAGGSAGLRPPSTRSPGSS
ncbi:MAG TPA: glutathione S-transferase N-terminal domain-containing protein, partial [Methyloceanibacter sp.]|nr:glutathione S-transferase N-terminal domain-containing protein [Methyloceanibacter sp.]